MNQLPRGFSLLYASGLRSHLLRSGEPALHQAYELGRQALGEGMSVLDISLVHHDAMAKFMMAHERIADPDWLKLAAEFLSECLSPFEMTLRGYRETNNRLSTANSELTQAHAAVATAHEQLKAEVGERKKAEEALLHAKKLQAVGLLAGGVAHHFNNLLTVVLGNLELLRMRLREDERAETLLLRAQSGAQSGAEVVRQLLSFSRQQILQPCVLDLEEWVKDIQSLLASTLRGDILVQTDIPQTPPLISIDPGQLELAILNLAVNARDVMPDGGTLKISVGRRDVRDGRLGLSGPFAVIEVADTGPGVDPDILPRVFEPFFTTKDGGPGAGLGLSQVHGFTHQSGGAVEMESRPGQGAVVRLYLPAAENQVTAKKQPKDQTSPQAGAGRLLVVEDDVAVGAVARDLLENLGYSVTLVDRAQAALDLIQDGEPVDLVFSDTVMPGGMSGTDLANELHRVRPRLPVLLTSGYSDALESLDAADLSFIVKPYRLEDLGQRIAELLHPGGASA